MCECNPFRSQDLLCQFKLRDLDFTLRLTLNSQQDNHYLPFSNNYQIQHVTKPGEVQEKLVFRVVQFEDTGFYECRASNLAGTSRTEFSLAVTGMSGIA